MQRGEDKECVTCSDRSHMQIRADVEVSWDRIDAILALKREVVVIRAFGDKAEELGNESDLHWSPPANEINRYLMHTVVLGHVVHCLTPTPEATSQTFLGMAAVTDMLRAEALKTWVGL